MSKERPILFSAPMVRAVLANGKPLTKYSPNLTKWLEQWRMRYGKTQHATPTVYREADTDTLWIGYQLDCDQSLIGCRLISVLCYGGQQQTANYINLKSLQPIADFWDQYARDGRCAIDPEHTMYFIGDETRWRNTSETTRVCTWCANQATQTLRRWTKTVEGQAWESSTAKQPAQATA